MGSSDERLPSAGSAVAERLLREIPDSLVQPWGLSGDGYRALRLSIDGLSDDEQVGLLLAAVESMPRLRQAGDEKAGPVMYAAAAELYGRPLRFDENVIARLLRTARHDCGHGADTKPPFELALRFQRERGYSPVLGAAIAEFVDNFPKSHAAKLQSIRRSAALLRVLERGNDPLPKLAPNAWINRVRVALAVVEGDERRGWERLVLSMKVGEQMTMPRTWVRQVHPILDELGAPTTWLRLEEWWPSQPIESLEGSGAQLLKHFIWTLTLTAHPAGESLVARLADISWKPHPYPMAVLKPAASFLADAESVDAKVARGTLQAAIDRGTRSDRPPTARTPTPDVPRRPLTTRLAGLLRGPR